MSTWRGTSLPMKTEIVRSADRDVGPAAAWRAQVSRRRDLTEIEAFRAMVAFLERYCERGESDEIAILLGSLAMQPDEKPADPALADEWRAAVRAVIAGREISSKDAA